MGNPVVDTEFDLLRVDEHHPHIAGAGSVEDTLDHGVGADRFTRSGSARDEQVRHLGQIREHDLARDIPAEGHGQLALGGGKFGGIDQLPQTDRARDAVGHLNAHRRLVGDGRLDAHAGGGQPQGDIIRKAGDPADLDPGAGLELIPGDRRAAGDVDHPRIHPEFLEGIDQQIGGAVLF